MLQDTNIEVAKNFFPIDGDANGELVICGPVLNIVLLVVTFGVNDKEPFCNTFL
jgi:hypothetical protein